MKSELKKFLKITLIPLLTFTSGIAFGYEDYPPIPPQCKDLPLDKPEIRNAPKGCYNAESFVLAWKPQWCYDLKYKPEGCNKLYKKEAAANLSPHGLWHSIINSKENKRSLVNLCKGNQIPTPQDLTKSEWSYLSSMYPLDRGDLFNNEVQKHGSCDTSITTSEFFEKIKHFYNSVKTPYEFKEKIGKSTTVQEINDMFHRKTVVWCSRDYNDDQYLNQIQFFYDPDSNPKTPPENLSNKFCDPDKPVKIRAVSKLITTSKHNRSIAKGSIVGENIGFDLDDTILFSQPGFEYGKKRYGPDFQNNPEFWNLMNNGLDNFSILKKNVLKIISTHLTKKHKIYIITARPKTSQEAVSNILRGMLKVGKDTIDNVIFVSSVENKHIFIKKKNINIYYGDGDTDMSEAIKAGATPIRILASDLSSDNVKMNNNIGRYGETIITDSNY